MNTKLQRELHGPSWTEVIFGAVLSLVLGVAAAFVYLVLKPVETVKALPKEPVADVVYYLEGSRNAGNARQATAKQKAFIEGGSVVLNEEELNVLTAPPVKSPAAGAAAEATASKPMVAPGVVNFRIRDSVMQIGVPLQLNIQGLELNLILQARGGFVKEGSTFTFAADEFLLGSCPLQRLPMAGDALVKRIIASAAVPAELTEAWRHLSDVAVEGSTLRLTAE